MELLECLPLNSFGFPFVLGWKKGDKEMAPQEGLGFHEKKGIET
jgi:hypothetical protein